MMYKRRRISRGNTVKGSTLRGFDHALARQRRGFGALPDELCALERSDGGAGALPGRYMLEPRDRAVDWDV